MLFGLVWGVDAALKFFPQEPFWFSERVLAASIGQPPWLAGWFGFWVIQAQQYAFLDVAVVAFLELCLMGSLLFGFLRKPAYLGGFLLSLLIWAVPEGFGGPFEATGNFDIGGGIVYAIAFLLLLQVDRGTPAPPETLDARIERRWPRWSWFANP